MILYSIIPADIVFGSPDGGEAKYLEAEYLGEKILVTRLENDDYMIARLLSTNPRAYLNQKLQPGSIVRNDGAMTIKS
jgi:hypothetical protein